ncbi:9623_t:CDS:2, partial [Acaulospora colombiana]
MDSNRSLFRPNTQYDGHWDNEETEDYERICELIKEISYRSKESPSVHHILDSYQIPEANNVGLLSLLQKTLQHGGRIPVPRPDLEMITDAIEQTFVDHELQGKVANILEDIVQRRLISGIPSQSYDTIRQHEPETSLHDVSLMVIDLEADAVSSSPTLSMPGGGGSKKRKRSVFEDIYESQTTSQEPILESIITPLTLTPHLASNSSQDPARDIHQAILQTLEALQNNRIDKAQIGSLQVQLHQIFLFAVSSPWLQDVTPGDDATRLDKRKILNQLSKLIQLLGVLSGVQISVGDVTNTLNVTIDEEAERHITTSPSISKGAIQGVNNLLESVQINKLQYTPVHTATVSRLLRAVTISRRTSEPTPTTGPINATILSSRLLPPPIHLHLSPRHSTFPQVTTAVRRPFTGDTTCSDTCEDTRAYNSNSAQEKQQRPKKPTIPLPFEGDSAATCINARYELVQVPPELKKSAHAWSNVFGPHSPRRDGERQIQEDNMIYNAPMELTFRLSGTDKPRCTLSNTVHVQPQQIEEASNIERGAPETGDIALEMDIELDLF